MSVFKDTEGFQIRVKTNKDLSTASVLRYDVRKPGSSTTVQWTCTVYAGDPTNMTMVYTTQNGDLSSSGNFSIQPYIEKGTYKGHADKALLNVLEHN